MLMAPTIVVGMWSIKYEAWDSSDIAIVMNH